MVSSEKLTATARDQLSSIVGFDPSIERLARAFAAASRELYLVGGPVRDALLGRRHGDLDFSTDAPPEETHEIVRPLATAMWLQGQRFGTIGVEIDGVRMEITTFRTENYAPSSRHPNVAYASDVITDLSRRDFTVNALAVRVPDGELIDPFNGVSDLKGRVLRTPIDPSESFTDDPLRMLRAFRFAAELEFAVHEDVLRAIRKLKRQITTVSAERIRDELSRLLVGAAPGTALDLAHNTGITDFFLPELSALRLEQDRVHKHKDVFAHTLAVVERTRPKLTLRLAALLHDIGKPKTRRIGPDGVSFHHHEIVGAQMAERRLKGLRYPNEVVTVVTELIRLHHRFHTYRLGWTDSAVRRYVRDAGPLLDDLNGLVRADCTTRNAALARELQDRLDELQRRIAELAQKEELQRLRPELDGHEVMKHLRLEPGPAVGEALRFLLEVRLEEGQIGKTEAYKRLDAWAAERGLEARDDAGSAEPS